MKRLLRFLCLMCLMTVTTLPARATNLPSGYTELEYVNMQSGSYLLTDIVPQADYKIEFEFKLKGFPSIGSTIMGTRPTGAGGSGMQIAVNPNGVFTLDGLGTRYNLTTTASLNTLYKYTWDNKVATVYQGSTVFDTTTFTGTQEQTYPLIINALNNAGTASTPRTDIYFYGLKIWNAQGELIADYVPAKYGNSVGVYDMVSNTFKTATSGTFTAGLAKCRNLYNKANGVLYGYPTSSFTWAQRGSDSAELTIMVKLTEGEQYTARRVAGANIVFRIQASSTPTLTNGQQLVNISSTSDHDTTKTFRVPTGAPYVLFYVRNVYSSSGGANASSLTINQVIDGFQVEQGSTATAYVPYCETGIKIATTKYTEEAFAGLMTTLSEAITKVTNIVDTTVQQATEIGNLATTKQDRPDTDCPAGRKCLLIMGADNKPHWYLIQE